MLCEDASLPTWPALTDNEPVPPRPFLYLRQYGRKHSPRSWIHELGRLPCQNLEHPREIQAATPRRSLQFSQPPNFAAGSVRGDLSSPDSFGRADTTPDVQSSNPVIRSWARVISNPA